MHVLEAFHRRVQMNVFDVDGHVFGGVSGEDVVVYDFGSSKVGRLGANVAKIRDFVAATGPAYAFCVGLVGIIGGHNLEVGGLAAFGNVGDVEEVHGVSAGYVVLAVTMCGSWSTWELSKEQIVK